MRKSILTLAALLATTGLVFSTFHLAEHRDAPKESLTVARVWVEDQEPSVWAWLRKAAADYERKIGVRVYLRVVGADRAPSTDGLAPPDLLISGEGGQVIALHGYALFFRDENGGGVMPVPTSLLFSRPTPSPGPSPTPGPAPDIGRFSVVLASKAFSSVYPGVTQSARPALDFMEGKGEAAILTVEQARQIPLRVSACPLPEGKGFISIRGSAGSPAGEAFLAVLLSEENQRKLADVGLYSPEYALYRGTDPLREMIENSL